MTLKPILDATPAIQVHLAVALGAILLSIAMLANTKGTPRHKLLGRIWVSAIAIISIGSFAIREINSDGSLSIIHLISAFTLVAIFRAIWAIRHGNVRAHKIGMLATMIGGLGVAGAFTLAPGRLMWKIFFG